MDAVSLRVRRYHSLSLRFRFVYVVATRFRFAFSYVYVYALRFRVFSRRVIVGAKPPCCPPRSDPGGVPGGVGGGGPRVGVPGGGPRGGPRVPWGRGLKLVPASVAHSGPTQKPLKNRFSELLATSRSFWNRLGASGIDLGCQGLVFAPKSSLQDAKSGLQDA